VLGVVGRAGTEGSQRLIQAAAKLGAEAVKAHIFTEAEREARRRNALARDQSRHLQPGYHGPWWTAEDLALLGTLPDAEVAPAAGKDDDGGAGDAQPAVDSESLTQGIP